MVGDITNAASQDAKGSVQGLTVCWPLWQADSHTHDMTIEGRGGWMMWLASAEPHQGVGSHDVTNSLLCNWTGRGAMSHETCR